MSGRRLFSSVRQVNALPFFFVAVCWVIAPFSNGVFHNYSPVIVFIFIIPLILTKCNKIGSELRIILKGKRYGLFKSGFGKS